MKIDWFYLRLFFSPDVFFTYLKRWWLFGERPPKETMLVGDRPLTKEEFEYGASLELEALRILQAVEHACTRQGAGGGQFK